MKSSIYPLGELVSIKYGKDAKKVFSKSGTIPIYGTGGLMGYATKALYDKPSVLIGRKGTIEKIRYVEHPFWTVDTLFYTIVKEDIVIPKFLYYNMLQLDLGRYNEGTSIPSLRTEALNRIELSIPDIETQKKIASILSPLDAKIELNNAINENLEQQAQSIFKSWFIDFDPFGGVMPADWQIGSLKQILKLKRNTIKAGENKNLPYLPIDVIPMHSLGTSFFRPNNEAKSSLIKFDKDDIIIGAMRVYFHRVIIAPCDGITRTTCFTLTPYDFDYLCFSLLYCNQNSSIEYASKTSLGSTMPYAIWENGLGDMEIIIPSKKISFNFNSIILPLIRKIQENCLENQRLASLRDTLLPKLMKGEIDVSKVKI